MSYNQIALNYMSITNQNFLLAEVKSLPGSAKTPEGSLRSNAIGGQISTGIEYKPFNKKYNFKIEVELFMNPGFLLRLSEANLFSWCFFEYLEQVVQIR